VEVGRGPGWRRAEARAAAGGRGELGEREAELGDFEHRIVPEAVRAARHEGDPTFEHTFAVELGPVLQDRRACGAEPGGALRPFVTGHHLEQALDVVVVGRVRTGEAGGIDSRFPAQDVHFETGVVRDRGHAGELVRRARLGERVLEQRVSRLGRRGGASEALEVD